MKPQAVALLKLPPADKALLNGAIATLKARFAVEDFLQRISARFLKFDTALYALGIKDEETLATLTDEQIRRIPKIQALEVQMLKHERDDLIGSFAERDSMLAETREKTGLLLEASRGEWERDCRRELANALAMEANQAQGAAAAAAAGGAALYRRTVAGAGEEGALQGEGEQGQGGGQPRSPASPKASSPKPATSPALSIAHGQSSSAGELNSRALTLSLLSAQAFAHQVGQSGTECCSAQSERRSLPVPLSPRPSPSTGRACRVIPARTNH